MSAEDYASGAQLADVTIPQLLSRRRVELPDEIAFKQKRRGEWIATTWKQYSDLVVKLAATLQKAGFERGDRASVLRALYARAGAGAPGGFVERRRSGPSAAVLRNTAERSARR